MIHIFSTIIRPNSLDVFPNLFYREIDNYLKDLKFNFYNVCSCDTSIIIDRSYKPL